jgi:hypothetical protein
VTRRFRHLNNDRTPVRATAPAPHRIAAGHSLYFDPFDATATAPQNGGDQESFTGEPGFFTATAPRR